LWFLFVAKIAVWVNITSALSALSVSFQKITRVVGRLGSGARLVANRADVVFTQSHPKMQPNLSKSQTFYQVWALRRCGVIRNHSQTRNCFSNCCAKN